MPNLIGTGLDQVSVNGMLGDFAFQNKESIEFTDGSGVLSQFSLAAINATKNITAVDVFVYDTSKDSDGGAWRKRTQHTSWYNEELNTATRGSRREFPSVAVIVVEGGYVTIYDGDDASLPMWMGFRDASYASQLWENAPWCTYALNGKVAVGSNPYDLNVVDFIADNAVSYSNSNSISGTHKFPISGRAPVTGTYSALSDIWKFGTVPDIIGRYINDVAMTVLPGAPIDVATGLPIPTIAVATDGGVSVIHNNGTVANITETVGPNSVHRVLFNGNKIGFLTSGTLGISGFPQLYYLNIPYSNVSASYFYTIDQALGWEMYDGFWESVSTNRLVLNSDTTSTLSGVTQNACSNDRGLNFIDRAAPDAGKGMVAYVTSKYNTGWIPGNIKGAWLSDTTQETVGNELVVDGGFETAANWTLIQVSATVTRTTESARTGSWGITATSTGGSNVYSGREITGLVIGKRYHFSVDYNNLNHDTSLQLNTGWANGGTTIVTGGGTSLNGWQVLQVTFVATTTSVWLNVFAQGTIYLDNLSLRTAEADRSVNNRGLQVFGNITKTPVATGADLVAYSGFSGGSYLQQPFNTGIDFGTGDFCVSAWITGNQGGIYGHAVSITNPGVSAQSASGTFHIKVSPDNTSYILAGNTSIGVSTPILNAWLHVCAVRRNGVVYVYFDGKLNSSAAYADSISGNLVRVGYSGVTDVVNEIFLGKIAMLSISATAPTDAQIKKMYEDAKYLFQDNAKATLFGTSDAVTALAYDDDTRLLHVGTSSGRSVFQGLRRIDNTTTPVARTISAAGGLVAED